MTEFQQTVMNYYEMHGRKDLPWRTTDNPYFILVSEFMLQQTQVSRVLHKYREFLERFPSVQNLADAEQKEVIIAWQGLGYNRRAVYLHKTAQIICEQYGASVPDSVETLQKLPGIGHATACEITAFAYKKKNAFIETNIRAVFIHHFFREHTSVADKDLLPIIEEQCPDDVRSWYYALMDYGVYLKKMFINPARKSKHHTVQSRFEGSTRQIRGKILKVLSVSSITRSELLRILSDTRSDSVIDCLLQEGLIQKSGNLLYL